MGTLFRRGKTWCINYRDPHGVQVRRAVSEYKETAELALKKTEVDIAEGRYLDKKRVCSVLFEDFADEFMTNYVNLENRSPRSQSGRVEVVKGHFKGFRLDQIDTRMIRAFLAQKHEVLKPGTVNRYLSTLKCMFNRAIEWKMMDGENLTKGIKKLAEDNERFCSLTDKEQALLLSHCHGMTHSIVLTALQTGLRWNELMSLKWPCSERGSYVDFDSNVS